MTRAPQPGPPGEELLAQAEAAQWEARITQAGDWAWHVELIQGLSCIMPGSIVFGTRQRAERVARRKIARLNRRDQRHNASYTIR